MRPIISADSHITEPANTYVDYIDAKWREKAPRMRYHESLGDAFFVEGLPTPVPMGLVAAAGKPPEEIRTTGVRFDDMHRGGWDPDARMAEQDRDGVRNLVAETRGPVGDEVGISFVVFYKFGCHVSGSGGGASRSRLPRS